MMLVKLFNWRNLLILTICFMGLHFYIYRDEYALYDSENSAEESPAVNNVPGFGRPDAQFAAPNPAPNPATNQVGNSGPLDSIPARPKPLKVETHPIHEVPAAEPEESLTHVTAEGKDEGKEGTASDKNHAPAAGNAVPINEYVAICMAVKDQSLDLPEFFIHHYNHLGIRRFYVMDDGSDPPLSSVSDYGIPRTALTFDYQDPKGVGGRIGNSQQLAIYQRCLENYGKNHVWMAFIDGDEFLETPGKETLVEILMKMEHDEKIGALGVNWRMHTSSGLLKRPASARKAFVECIWDDPENGGVNSNNTHVKSIVKVPKAERPFNPHLWALKDGAQTVGENGDAITSEAFRLPITRNRVALHHYAGKSREEFEAKMLRGNAMDDPKGEDFWNSLEHLLPHVNCPEMAKYDP